MTKVITVHGTNDGSPHDAGSQWWQNDSSFQKKLKSLVVGSNGSVEIIPFHWSGDNSEIARRRAAAKLLKLVDSLRKNGDEVTIIGHSHGGSVAYEMIKLGQIRNQKRLGLFDKKSNFDPPHVISVGTPFISYDSISYFRQLIRAAIAMMQPLSFLLWLPILFGVALYLSIKSGAFQQHILPLIGADLVSFYYTSHAILLLALVLAIIWQSAGRWSEPIRLSKTNLKGRFDTEHFKKISQEKWLALWHSDDEAVNALTLAQGSQIKLAPKDFGANAINFFIAIPILALAFLWFLGFATSGVFDSVESELTSAFAAPSTANDTPENIRALQELLLFNLNAPFSAGFMTVFLWIAAFSVIASTTKPLAKLLGRIPSKLANNAITNLGRRRSFGMDVMGLKKPRLTSQPPDFSYAFEPLPDEIAAPISDLVSKRASELVEKGRMALGLVHAGADISNILEDIVGSVTWDELIHTAYFETDKFTKFVAIALIESGAGAASQQFKNDPDFLELVQLFKNSDPRMGAK